MRAAVPLDPECTHLGRAPARLHASTRRAVPRLLSSCADPALAASEQTRAARPLVPLFRGTRPRLPLLLSHAAFGAWHASSVAGGSRAQHQLPPFGTEGTEGESQRVRAAAPYPWQRASPRSPGRYVQRPVHDLRQQHSTGGSVMHGALCPCPPPPPHPPQTPNAPPTPQHHSISNASPPTPQPH